MVRQKNCLKRWQFSWPGSPMIKKITQYIPGQALLPPHDVLATKLCGLVHSQHPVPGVWGYFHLYQFSFFGPSSLVFKVIFCFLHLICVAAFLARGDLKMEKTHGTETPSAENLIASAFEAKRIIPQRTVTKSLRQQVSILFSFLCFPFFLCAAPDLLRCHCVSDN